MTFLQTCTITAAVCALLGSTSPGYADKKTQIAFPGAVGATVGVAAAFAVVVGEGAVVVAGAAADTVTVRVPPPWWPV